MEKRIKNVEEEPTFMEMFIPSCVMILMMMAGVMCW